MAKTPPVYLHKQSCHDVKVFNGIFKGVALRIRETNSTEEGFNATVEEFSIAFANSGHSYHKAKKELSQFKEVDPVEIIKRKGKGRQEQRANRRGCVAFWNAPFDPRMPPPRVLISKHYHHIKNDPVAAKLFPRRNLMSSAKRPKNLSELLAPTKQLSVTNVEKEKNGSYHCERFRRGQNCDTCAQMVERDHVYSEFRKHKFAIHGRNVHLPATVKQPTLWFIYLLECIPCHAQYVGSTKNVASRFKNHKSNAHLKNSTSSGMAKHFSDICPNDDNDPQKPQLKITLIDFMHTSNMKLQTANHVPGPQCRCIECGKLKDLEDKWIMRLGTYEGMVLNDRNEIKSKCRGQW